MNQWVVWGCLIDLVLLVVFATANLALRWPSRVRISEQFERAGKNHQLERLKAIRFELILTTATIRSATSLALVLFVLNMLDATAWPTLWLYAVSFASAWVLSAIFGVAIPMAIAKYVGEHLLLRLTPLLFMTRWLLFPFVWPLTIIDPLVRRLSGIPITESDNNLEDLGREILNVVSEGEKQGAVDEQEKEMIESVIELRNTEVHEIMTPRTEIIAMPEDATQSDIRNLICAYGHSRIPVYHETIDTIVGVLYAKDLLQNETEPNITAKSVMRPVSFVPETKRVRELLDEFQKEKVHISVILDEYGGTAGLITIEDILEELVGEITDEYEAAEPEPFVRIDDHTVEVDARMRIDALNDEWDADFPEHDDYETVGGFVFSTLGRIPKTGEKFEHENVHIEIIAAESRKINRLRLHTINSNTNGQSNP